MTHEIRETKEKELEELEDSINGLKYLLKLNKVKRKRLRKELTYVIKESVWCVMYYRAERKVMNLDPSPLM